MTKHSIDSARKKFEERGYILLSTVYINNEAKLRYSCPKHGELTITYASFLEGHGCKQCGRERQRKAVESHGCSNTQIYSVWQGMKRRCDDQTRKEYKRYGAKGVTVCSEWYDFDTFLTWSLLNGWSEGLTLDRKDTTKGYSPDNCRWITWKAQTRNKRNTIVINIDGVDRTPSELADLWGTTRSRVYDRARKGDLRPYTKKLYPNE